MSASRTYLWPIRKRPNLDVVTRALATQVLFEGDRAVGVEYRRPGGRTTKVHAAEIILCGGAINTPQLLQLSGVGPADLLSEHGIDVVRDLPGVGANMQDHLEVYVQQACSQPVSMARYTAKWRMPFIGLQWLARRGPAATSHFEAGGFARSNDSVDRPNVMFHFLPLAIRYDGSQPAESEGYQLHVGPMFSQSRGTVRIRSRDPRDHPELRFNYLDNDTDRKEWVEAVRLARTLLAQPAFDAYNAGELSPGADVETDEQILDWVRRDAETALHPSCTARMGTDAMSVLDPATMRVHGLSGLRVVDASAMPAITNGNIYAPVMMIAERAADMCLGNTQLAPETVRYHRATASDATSQS